MNQIDPNLKMKDTKYIIIRGNVPVKICLDPFAKAFRIFKHIITNSLVVTLIEHIIKIT
jgi:hypothetical protein